MSNQNDSSVGGKTWELSPYELHRQPQEVITDYTEIAVSPRSLHSELMCPICLDMLKNTMTTKECLHRFCQECIITALRSGNKECPTCRKKLISKRSLRPDPNFDMLISKIYPNREEYDAQQEKMMNNVKKHRIFSQNIEETFRMQVLNRGARASTGRKSLSNEDANRRNGNDHSENSSANNSSSISTNNTNISSGDDELELVLTPLNYDPNSNDEAIGKRRFVKTDTFATIDHLATYLAIRYDVASNNIASTKINNSNGECSSSATTSSKMKNQSENSIAGTNHNNNDNCDEPSRNQSSPSSSLFTIFIMEGPGQYKPLPGDMKLSLVLKKFWHHNRPLELYHAFKFNSTS